MQPSEENSFGNYLAELVSSTRAGLVHWEKLNPSTYAWKTQQNARIMVQQTPRNVHVMPLRQLQPQHSQQDSKVYILTAEDLNAGSIMLSVNSMEVNPALGTNMRILFETIESRTSEVGIAFLRSVPPPPVPIAK